MTEYIKVTVQATEPNVINVASSQTTPNLKVTIDPTEQNAKLSRDWAIGEGLIQNEDYSSKTWAGESKSSADLSKMYSEAASLDLNNLENKIIEYDEQLNTTITEGVETIETLQANSIAKITTNKESALSDITTAETNVLNNIDTDFTNATNEINTNRANTLAQISTLANTSISDINAVGKSYDNLTYRNITNCLLEVPQRIKYDLTDGTLTVKAGTVVIVPYGTEDKTSELPVGATFINDNFTVYDTQYSDGKFFVWAELVGDMSFAEAYTSSVLCYMVCDLAFNTLIPLATVDKNLAYNTSTNLVQHANLPGGVMTLPVGLCYRDTTGIGSVTQVFNGFGYIGSTVWVDKGVKGLYPNGKNEDGTLNNIEINITKLTITTNPYGANPTPNSCMALTTSGYVGVMHRYIESNVEPTTAYTSWYNPTINKMLYAGGTAGKWVEQNAIPIASLNWTYVANPKTNTFTSLVPKQPFRAVDYSDYVNDIDGKYTYKNRLVVSSQENLKVETGVIVDYNLSEFLPKDNNSYIVGTNIAVQTGASTGAYCHVWTASSDNIIGVSCGGNTTNSYRQTFVGGGWTLVRPDRILRTFRSCSGSAGILYGLEISSYRKVR